MASVCIPYSYPPSSCEWHLGRSATLARAARRMHVPFHIIHVNFLSVYCIYVY